MVGIPTEVSGTVDSRIFVWDVSTLSWIKATASASGASNVNVVNFPSVYPVNDNGGSLTIDDGGGSVTVDGTVSAAQSGAWSVNVSNGAGVSAVNIQDGGNSITIDSGQLPAALTGSGNLKISLSESVVEQAINDGGNLISIDDGAGSITVDGTISAIQSGAWSVNVNNGAGASAVNIQDGGNLISVDDGAGSITVDAPVGTPVATRLSDGTSFLTTPSGRLSVDASGVAVPVTDNGGSLTIDNPVLVTSPTATHTDIAGTATVVTLQAANTSRLGWSLFNDSNKDWYVRWGSAASLTNFDVLVTPAAYLELPFRYTGIITGLQSSAAGFARVAEFT